MATELPVIHSSDSPPLSRAENRKRPMVTRKLLALVTLGATAFGTAAGAFGHSRAASPAEPQEQRTMSAPAITTADLTALREHLDRRLDAQGDRLGILEQGLAGVQGYMKAQEKAALDAAIAGRR